MAKRPSITPVSVGSASLAINQNLNRIAEAFDEVLSRDGSTPNEMKGDLDMNSNDLLNVRVIEVENLYVNGIDVSAVLGPIVVEGTPHDFVADYEQGKL